MYGRVETSPIGEAVFVVFEHDGANCYRRHESLSRIDCEVYIRDNEQMVRPGVYFTIEEE